MAKIILLLILAPLIACLSADPKEQINKEQNISLITQRQLKLDRSQTILILHNQQKRLILNLSTIYHNQINDNFQFAAIILKNILGSDKGIKMSVFCLKSLFQLEIKEYYNVKQITQQCKKEKIIKKQNVLLQKIEIIFESLNSVHLFQISLSDMHYPLQISQNLTQRHNIYFRYYKLQQQQEVEVDFLSSIPIKFVQISFNQNQSALSLKLQRLKGYPTIYFYQCDKHNLQACKQQIQNGYIQGFILLKRIQTIRLQKDEQNCPNCLWLIGIKQQSQMLQLSLQWSFEDVKKVNHINQFMSQNLANNEVKMGKLDQNQKQQRYNVFLQTESQQSNQHTLQQFCIDITIQNFNIISNLGQKLRKMQNKLSRELSKYISFQLSTYYSDQKVEANLKNDFYEINIHNKLIRITKRQNQTFSFNQFTIFKIMIIIKLPRDCQSLQYLIINHNLKQNNFRLPDGLTISTYPLNNERRFFQFQANSNHFGILHITALNCSDLAKIQIQSDQIDEEQSEKSTQNKSRFKIQPKLFLPVQQNHAFCSQLIQIHSSGINQTIKETFLKNKITFNKLNHSDDQTQASPFFLTFSSHQPIFLPLNFIFSNLVQYQTSNFYIVSQIKGQVEIKIRKCTQCQISVYYFQQNLMKSSLFAKRNSQANYKAIQELSQTIKYEMKHGSNLYLQITTNNFAYYNIQVSNQLVLENGDIQTNVDQQNKQNVNQQNKHNNKITYSLNEDGILYIEFYQPKFNTRTHIKDSQNFHSNDTIMFFLIQGSIKNQVARQIYCPQNIFTVNQRIRDVSISEIKPHRKKGQQNTYQFNITLKHHDYFGIRANTNHSYYSYQIVDIQNMKQYSTYRWAIFHTALFITLAIFFSFVCFLVLKRKTFKTKGYLSQEYQNQERQNLKQLS